MCSEKANKIFTADEIQQAQEKMRKHFKDENSYLQLQATNARLKAEIKQFNVLELKASYEEVNLFAQIAQMEKEAESNATDNASKIPPQPKSKKVSKDV